MTLAQLGADVIRFDDLGGGLDHQRWPLAKGGQSLFWAGLNKGKRSLRVNLRSDEGRELVTALIAAAGAFITNFPARGWLGYDALRGHREDLVMVWLTGNRDGSSEVDYTVNPATGFPWATGPRNLTEPLNSVLPAWDAIMGGLAATGLLAADRHRTRTGTGQLGGSRSPTSRSRWSGTSAASRRRSSAARIRCVTGTISTARSGTTSQPATAAG